MKLNIKEIAKRLDLNMDTLDRWIKQGRIPVKKKGNEGIFNESELKRWALSQRCSYRISTRGDENVSQGCACMLASAMEHGGCFSDIKGGNKDAVLKACVDLVPDLSPAISEILYTQLLQREALISTGIGKGIAIPHPRNPLEKGISRPMIVTCFLEKPIDFNSIDDLPVFVLFLLLSPSVQDHLKLLSRLSFCLREATFVSFLKRIPKDHELLARIKKMEITIETKER